MGSRLFNIFYPLLGLFMFGPICLITMGIFLIFHEDGKNIDNVFLSYVIGILEWFSGMWFLISIGLWWIFIGNGFIIEDFIIDILLIKHYIIIIGLGGICSLLLSIIIKTRKEGNIQI